MLPTMNALEYPFYQSRDQTVDGETRDVVMIRPRYDKLTPATRANKAGICGKANLSHRPSRFSGFIYKI